VSSAVERVWFDELGSSPAFLEWNDPHVTHDVKPDDLRRSRRACRPATTCIRSGTWAPGDVSSSAASRRHSVEGAADRRTAMM